MKMRPPRRSPRSLCVLRDRKHPRPSPSRHIEGGAGFVYLLGRRDKVLKRFSIQQTDRPTKFSFESKSGVHRALITHLGSIIAIDDLTYTVD